ncbi:MAG: hypothetical protein FWE22_06570 [Firmicutes bacterium]|nr:hypothetical protein [Bacillota bacterium]
MEFVHFIGMGVFVLLIFVFLYKVLLPVNMPDFRETGALSLDKLNTAIYSLALKSKNITHRGKGLSLKLIRRTIKKAFRIIAQKVENDEEIFEFEKWLYDNFYKLEERYYSLKKELFKFYFLPHSNDLPRVYEFVQLVVKGCEGGVCDTLIKKCVDEFCSETPLTFDEILAMRASFDYALLEFVSIFASKTIKINSLVQKGKIDAKRGKIYLSNLSYNSYIYGLKKYASGEVSANLTTLSLDNGMALDERVDNFYRSLAHYNGQVQNSITTLFALDRIFTENFVLELSPTHLMLKNESGILYDEVTTKTKFNYLKDIAIKSKKEKISELGLSRNIIEKSKKEETDISFQILRGHRSKGLSRLYLFLTLLLTAGLSVVSTIFLGNYFWVLTIVSLPISFVMSHIVLAYFLKNFSKSRYLPSIDTKHISCNEKALITTCRLIRNADEIKESFSNIETLYYSNGKQFSYCLLLDLPSHNKDELREEDTKLLSTIKKIYEKFSHKEQLLVVVRKRRKVKDRELFQGWEKKRGALLELNRLILNGDEEPFLLKLGTVQQQIKFVITLDSDTFLNCSSELIGILSHPYLKETNILSLNMATKLTNDETYFARFFCGVKGLSNYSNFHSSVENTVFGGGNFTGKGIYRVKEFQEKLEHAFLDERILSHDYIEGAIANCSNCSETALDSFPNNFSSYLARQVRWLRGDWQLLPFLFRRTRNSKGEKTKNSISPLAKWHIFSNMFRSLVPISAISLLLMSFIFTEPYFIFLIAFSIPLLHIFLSIRSSFKEKKNVFFHELIRQFFQIAFLPLVAVMHLVAIGVTLYRLLMKKNLLEWTVFAHSNGRVNVGVSLVASIVFIATTIIYSFPFYFYILGGIFLLSIPLKLILERNITKKLYRNKNFDNILKDIFHDTYQFFVDERLNENHLICDNIQEDKVAARTSPTNIAFSILAHICAFEMQYLESAVLNEKCKKIIEAVLKLDKFEGNLFNWYDTKTLSPLYPRYVSSVDMGNFLMSLLTLLPYCDEKLKPVVEKLLSDAKIETLFDDNRGLFRIGYNADTALFDENHYDLIGSESMITYLVSIALGKIGRHPWNELSRVSVKYKNRKMFYSWTGGAFEYLMSSLFFDFVQGTALEKTAQGVIFSHISYSIQNKLRVWGISESQHTAQDENSNYQYKAHGIPDIALANVRKTGIISPYASLLALCFQPRKVERNLHSLEQLGMAGEYGLYEAIDLEKNIIMKTQMAHHAGMTLLSICNYLTDNEVKRKLKTLGNYRAVELLLTETEIPNAKKKIKPCKTIKKHSQESLTVDGRYKIQYSNFLSSGKYSIINYQNGGGISYYGDIALTREKRKENGSIFAAISGKRYSLNSGLFHINQDSTSYEEKNEKFSSSITILPLPNGKGEIQKVKFRNITNENLSVKFETYIEPVLTQKQHDIAHMAFSNLFVEVHYDDFLNILWAKRTNNNSDLMLAHFVQTEERLSFVTNRGEFYGRTKSKSSIYPLDPVMSASFSVELKPRETKEFNIVNTVGIRLDEIKNTIQQIKVDGFFDRIKGNNYALAKEMSLKLSTKKIASKLIFGANSSVKEELNIDSINQNRPIVTIQIKNENARTRLYKTLKELKKLYRYNIEFNLALIYSEKHNYYLTLQSMVNSVLDELNFKNSMNNASTLTLVNVMAESKKARQLIENAVDIEELNFSQIAKEEEITEKGNPHKNAEMHMYEIIEMHGIGGFMADSSYAMNLSDIDTPAPWINVVSNENFGTVITECGGGFTYHKNSALNKLTAHSNDAVLDKPSEYILISERSKEAVWSITKKPIKQNSEYYVRHNIGFSEFKNNFNGILGVQKVFISENTKFYDITLTNKTTVKRNLNISFSCAPVLGDFSQNTHHALTIKRLGDNRLLVKNCLTGKKFYLSCSCEMLNFSKIKDGELLATISTDVELNKEGTARIIFSLSADESVDFLKIDEIFSRTQKTYSSISKIELKTKLNGFEHLSKWIPYQVLCSRFFARTGFYQVSGAYGFRDQLQDCLSLLYYNPKLVKKHILRCCSVQFEKGDVLHWWHEPKVGVRTHFSDDRLFLPFVVAEYISFTKDYSILSERVPFLKDVKLLSHEKARYEKMEECVVSGIVLDHCLKAIYVSCDFGDNGLVKMGGGDWNDAMDEVGKGGVGTSVFSSMLLYDVIGKIFPFVKEKKDRAKLLTTRQKLKKAIEGAHDGEWYLRAFTDEKLPLGSPNSHECKIDLLSQSWAVLSGVGDTKTNTTALLAAERHLVDRENKMIKLLTPPFKDMKKIGYISKYPKGVRENGGQYTHATVWYIMALIRTGFVDKAWELFSMISPLNHSKTLKDCEIYKREPYVVAADIYSGDHAGEGGWSYYTGAVSWFYKCLMEEFIGINIQGNILKIEPNLPSSINHLELTLYHNNSKIDIQINNSNSKGTFKMFLGKIEISNKELEIPEYKHLSIKITKE